MKRSLFGTVMVLILLSGVAEASVQCRSERLQVKFQQYESGSGKTGRIMEVLVQKKGTSKRVNISSEHLVPIFDRDTATGEVSRMAFFLDGVLVAIQLPRRFPTDSRGVFARMAINGKTYQAVCKQFAPRK